MLDVPLIRDPSSNHGTEGFLYARGFRFYTMEPPDRGNRLNLSCIPPGIYIVKRRWSQKYKEHYWVTEVESRTVILMHSGNLGGDRLKGLISHTWGCILLGLSRGHIKGQRAILSSRTAVRRFQSLLGFATFRLIIMEAEYGSGIDSRGAA